MNEIEVTDYRQFQLLHAMSMVTVKINPHSTTKLTLLAKKLGAINQNTIIPNIIGILATVILVGAIAIYFTNLNIALCLGISIALFGMSVWTSNIAQKQKYKIIINAMNKSSLYFGLALESGVSCLVDKHVLIDLKH